MKTHSIPLDAFFLTHHPFCSQINNSQSHAYTPYIFDLLALDESVPTGFNAVKIPLDGSVSSSLDWKREIRAAKHYIDLGFAIFWELNLGIFSQSHLSLSDQTQFLTLGLSVEHFRDTIWKEFSSMSLGVSIYQGPADFSRNFLWHEEQITLLQGWLKDRFQNADIFYQDTAIFIDSFERIDPLILGYSSFGQHLLALFCRDTIVEYLELLTNRLPDEISIFVKLDGSQAQNPLLLSQLFSKERFGRMHLALIPGELSIHAFTCDPSETHIGSISRELTQKYLSKKISIGICFPSISMCRPIQYEGMHDALIVLKENEIAYRIIPEIALTTEWDGLDYLLVSPQGISGQGYRKLQGFCAAGGTIVSLGNAIHMPQEISFTDWIKKIRPLKREI